MDKKGIKVYDVWSMNLLSLTNGNLKIREKRRSLFSRSILETIIMTWIFLSLLAAFGQALAWALKKKTLETQGINNIIGTLSFLVAGLTLGAFWLLQGKPWPNFTQSQFLIPLGVMVLGNIIAVWAAYRALDKGSFSHLMPLMAMTALLIVPIEYFFRGVIPTGWQLAGITVIIAGACLLQGIKREKVNPAVYCYFGITLLSYSFMPVFQALTVDATGDGLFAAAVIHLGVGLGFIPLILLSKEYQVFGALASQAKLHKVLWFILASGLVVGFLENGPATIALEQANASEVFALKRTMPFFALLLGAFFFRERITPRHIWATALLVIGSAGVVYFR